MNERFMMEKFDKRPYAIKMTLGSFLLRIRDREAGLTRKLVAGHTKISVRTLNNLENTPFVSVDLILRVFHYYVFSGYVTPVEKRLFLYLLGRIRRLFPKTK